ncbi:type ISP restriction/modification enzyme [Sphingobium ummariense]|uniref:type ISP restriction/modification enzyme n=1 Tax=Sphingobium ummariense TaxID=420994 RepID=UPI00042228B7|nr:type ISP restriction/modification enzyme [Sphingobium ummariense]
MFNLRGNQRTSGELSKREGGKIFGQGSRAPVAISFLVKNPNAADTGQIFYHDIGDYLTREQKLEKVAAFGSVVGLRDAGKWAEIVPDEHNDWITQRDANFDRYVQLGNKDDKTAITVFETYSRGIETGRDAWVINSSKQKVVENCYSTIAVYNDEKRRLQEIFNQGKFDHRSARPHLLNDETQISWTRSLINDLLKSKDVSLHREHVVQCVAKPFTMQWLYFDKHLNHERGQLPRMFPGGETKNLAIWVTGVGATVPFACYISGHVPSREGPSSTQCFPLRIYDAREDDEDQDELFSAGASANATVARDGITDAGLQHFQTAYPNAKISKEDIFYYVYGLLHSEEYRERFADNLSKQLPRIPTVKQEADFWTFVEAGRKLGDLHVNYETVEPYAVTYKEGDLRLANVADPIAFYRVEQMKFAGKRPNLDKTTVIYNPNITMTNIPLEAYEYVVNGKSALDWVMERQCVKTDKASGIVNDANDYANETMHNPAYPLELFQRVITVSLETMKIVRSLPKLEID